MNKTIVFTSKKNFAWTSMQEIIPFIENAWLKTESDTHAVELINIDDSSILKNAKKVMSATNVVMTCFTVEMSLGLGVLRGKLNLDFRLFYYVHGSASIGHWPLINYNLGTYLTKNDIFVVTCDGDKRLTEIALPETKILKHPFLNSRESEIRINNTIEELVYIGRISEQKNIHALFVSLTLIKDFLISRNIKLRIFGGEDNLGSPNMGKKSSSYLMFLEDLAKDLVIEDLIIFEGHVSRERLDSYLEKTSVLYVAPSLHSDENFGMSPYNILKKGGKCLLSDWGGFSEFKEWFHDQVTYFSIFSGEYGPFLSISNMAQSIKHAIEKDYSTSKDHYKNYYSFDSITAKLLKVLEEENLHQEPIKPSSKVGQILANREEYISTACELRKNSGSQIFSGYDDQLARRFLNGYAGRIEQLESVESSKIYKALDWLEVTNKNIYLKDPRTGEITLPRNKEEKKIVKIKMKNEILLISEREFEKLYSLGYLYLC
ncbi:MAG: hypothetical protein ACJAS4_003454 [Bacteriovoracaceae bacterium]|jgi:hypothetical protein